MPDSTDRTSRTEWIRQLPTKNSCLVTLFFVAGIVTAVSTLVTAGITLKNWQESKSDWRPAEYKKLYQLRAGQTMERFQEILGHPAYRTESENGITTNVFHPRKDYWVEVKTDASNTTLSYSVTSCSDKFRPTFQFRNGDSWVHVQLNKRSFQSVLTREDASSNGSNIRVFIAGATAPEYAFQTYIGGNSTSYRTYAWGINDSCAAWTHEQIEKRLNAWRRWYLKHPARKEGPLILPGYNLHAAEYRLLQKSIPNTYAETAPLADIETVYPGRIGVNRITIRP